MRWASIGFFAAAIVAALVQPPRARAVRLSAAAASLPLTASASSSTTTDAELPPDAIVIPVAGVRREELRAHNFNEGRAGHVHHALDILAPRGTPVVAAVDGRIRKLFTSREGGLTIYETDAGEERIYYYAHLDGYAANVREGMPVRRGDLIGYVGTTGNAPAATPHLHFSIAILPPSKEWWKGEAIDPYPLLAERGVTVAP